MLDTLPLTPLPRRRRPRRARRHLPSPRLSRRLDEAIEELERWLLLLYAPDGRRDLLEREDPADITAALHLARRAAARDARTDWLPAWPTDTRISNHDALPLVQRAHKTLLLVEARHEGRRAM